MAIIIALNIVFAALVVGSMVALHGRAIMDSREEPAVEPRRARVRTQPARRLATVNG